MTADEIWEECICDSLGDMNIFADVNELGEFMEGILPEIQKAARPNKAPTQTWGTPEGKASRENYTKEQYDRFGWVRANEVVNSGYWNNFAKNYAEAVYNKGFDRITPDGEYMIEIYDQNLEEGLQVIDHIVFAKGSIKSPKVTKIIQIYEHNENKLDTYRRNIYDVERRGIQQEAGELFEIYRNIDFGAYDKENYSGEVTRYNNQFRTERAGSGSQASRVKKYTFESEVSTQNSSLEDGKASREIGSKYASPEEAKVSGKVSDAKFSIEFADNIANNQRKFVADGLSRISGEELEKAIADTAHMVQEMKPCANILPQNTTEF